MASGAWHRVGPSHRPHRVDGSEVEELLQADTSSADAMTGAVLLLSAARSACFISFGETRTPPVGRYGFPAAGRNIDCR